MWTALENGGMDGGRDKCWGTLEKRVLGRGITKCKVFSRNEFGLFQEYHGGHKWLFVYLL